jgi:hypothetical protein
MLNEKGSRRDDRDKAGHSTLSGGALNLPKLETNDCPLPNLQITVRLFSFYKVSNAVR